MQPTETDKTSYKKDALILLIIGLFLLISSRVLIPDSYEVALLADCLWTGEATGIACSEVSWNFRPPGGSLLIGALLPLVSSLQALHLLCVASSMLMLGSLVVVGRDLKLGFWRWIGVSWLLVAPSFRHLMSVVDARVLVLGVLFFAWTLATRLKSRKQAFLVGLLIGLAALIRPEQQLAIPLCIAFVAWQRGRWALWSLLGSAICIVGWVFSLSMIAGQLVVRPRHWEGWLLQMLEIVPLRWTQQMWGMGIWNTPLREVTMQELPPAISLGVELVDFSAYLSGLTDAVPLWIIIASIASLSAGLWYRSSRVVTVAGLLMVMPSVMANVLPQARDPFFPSSNLFPLLFVMGSAPTLALTATLKRHFPHKKILLPLVITPVVLFAFSVEHHTIPHLPTLSKSKAFVNMKEVLHKIPVDAQVTASYETAPVLFQSDRKWQQWPSPFENRSSEWILVSSIDDKVWSGRVPENLQPASLWYWTADDEQWMLLFRRHSKDTSPVLSDPCLAMEDPSAQDQLLRATLARECLLVKGETMNMEQWKSIAAKACHPIQFARQSPEMCVMYDPSLYEVYRRRCEVNSSHCYDSARIAEAMEGMHRQLLRFIPSEDGVGAIAMQLGCGHPVLAQKMADELVHTVPRFAMYMASCADRETYRRHMQEQLASGGIDAGAALLAIMRRGDEEVPVNITSLASENSLPGILARYLLATSNPE